MLRRHKTQRRILPVDDDHHFLKLNAGVHQRRWQQQDGEHLQKVRERGEIFKRMRRVDTEETAAICANLFDCDLRRSRAKGICVT
jgi:hypothetical protein